MSRKIKVTLSPSSFRAAAREVQKYRDGLQAKCQTFVERLAEVGAQEARARVSQSPLGRTITISTEISPSKAGCKAILFGVGETKQSPGYEPINTLVMVEFGAGITYNPTDNPKAKEFGMGVGTYPGQIHAFDKGGWSYMGEDGEWHHSYGIKATMPMYGAASEMRKRVLEIAREVFGG